MATRVEAENCYRYILGREMVDDEAKYLAQAEDAFSAMPLESLRSEFFRSPEFHTRYAEDLFGNFMPKSKIVAYDTARGFRIYLDLRQLHVSFGIMNEDYETREVDLLMRMLGRDEVFYDIGANCGYYSLCARSQSHYRGRVVAFEPMPQLAGLLRRSIAENQFGDRLSVRESALGHQPGTMAVTSAEDGINIGATELAMPGSPAPAGKRVIKIDTLDRASKDCAPDVMKVDIQGAEGLLFHGGEKTIGTARPSMVFEVAPQSLKRVSGVSPSAIHRWLTQMGYGLWIVEPHGLTAANESNFSELIGQDSFASVLAVHGDRQSRIQEALGAAA